MSATSEEYPPRAPDPADDRLAAGQRVLEMFVAICGAPDDECVAAEGNRALAELTRRVQQS